MRHRVLTAVLTLVFCVGCCLPALAAEKQYENLTDLGLSSKSALLMEEDTGTILYEQNSHEALPPASVTKVMTLLLIMKENGMGSLTGRIRCRSANMRHLWAVLRCFWKKGKPRQRQI